MPELYYPVTNSFLERETHNRGRPVSSGKGAEMPLIWKGLKIFLERTNDHSLQTGHQPQAQAWLHGSPVWGNNGFTNSFTYVSGYLQEHRSLEQLHHHPRLSVQQPPQVPKTFYTLHRLSQERARDTRIWGRITRSCWEVQGRVAGISRGGQLVSHPFLPWGKVGDCKTPLLIVLGNSCSCSDEDGGL